MTFDIYKLYFQTPLHLSRGKLNTYSDSDDTLHSDTIKSALYATALSIYEKAELPDNFLNCFRVSSAFPFEGDLLWFPRPMSYQPDPGAALRKEIKKLDFLPQPFFEELLGNPKCNWKKLLDENDKIRQPKVFEEYMTQRVQIEQEDARSTPFYIVKHYPSKLGENGLYFMVKHDGSDPHFLPRMNGLLKLLGENGIGLQRGLGNGQFVHRHQRIELALPADGNAALSLSLYSPGETELPLLDLTKSCYQFIQRGGWISSPENEAAISLRKKGLYMFTEGSVFKTTEALELNGRIVDVAPDNTVLPVNSQMEHEIWRDGSIFLLPIKI